MLRQRTLTLTLILTIMGGTVTEDPVTEGDYLCYIPAHDGKYSPALGPSTLTQTFNGGINAEVYQIESGTVSEDGRANGRFSKPERVRADS